MRRRRLAVRAVAAALVGLAAAPAFVAPRAEDLGPTIDLRPGQEATFAATLVGGGVTLGPARVSNIGTAQPRDGEITVGAKPGGLSPYATLTVTEKTAEPMDFYATGFIDRIKIDEVRLCGRPDAPASTRIAAGSRRIALNRFAVRNEGEACR